MSWRFNTENGKIKVQGPGVAFELNTGEAYHIFAAGIAVACHDAQTSLDLRVRPPRGTKGWAKVATNHEASAQAVVETDE